MALLGPAPGGPLSGPAGVRAAVEVLQSEGYRRVVSPALAPVEQEAYLANGFTVRERLHLLERPVRLADLRPPAGPDGVRTSRALTQDRPEVLALDHRAFDDFWQLDEPGLLDALAATPTARFRVALLDDRLVGYAITGRAGRRGYLQRLAVDPDVRRRGIASALVDAGVAWLARHGVRSLLVNTQERNEVALALYERLGFTHKPAGLAVLQLELPEPPVSSGP